MVLTPIMSRVRATAAVSGGVAMVCVACAGFHPRSPAATTSPCFRRSRDSPRGWVAQVTLLPTLGDHRGDPRCAGPPADSAVDPVGGSSGGFGRVWPGTRWRPRRPSTPSSSGSSSSSSGGSTGHHVRVVRGAPGWSRGSSSTSATGSACSSDDSKTSSDSKTSGDPGTENPPKPADAGFRQLQQRRRQVAGPRPRPAASPPTRPGASDNRPQCVRRARPVLQRPVRRMRGRTVAALEGGAAAVRPQG